MAFEVRVPGVEELEVGDPATVAAENARRKARSLAARGLTVMAADTVVELDGVIYGKPLDQAEARRTLSALAGHRHTVITAVCRADGSAEREGTVSTGVWMRAEEPRLLSWYLAAGEWRGRAGGYAIQGRGAALVERIDGDWTNVVGLPVGLVLELVPEILG